MSKVHMAEALASAFRVERQVGPTIAKEGESKIEVPCPATTAKVGFLPGPLPLVMKLARSALA